MEVQCDWHSHSRHSPCGKPQATMALMLSQAREAGIRHLGVTDHINCRLNDAALLAARAEFDALDASNGLYFGLEVSCLRQYDLERNDERGEDGEIYGYQNDGPADGELALYLPDDLLGRLRPAYLIGGVHWPLGAARERDAVIRQYHRQYMFLATHPRVDIVAHPWWWVSPHSWNSQWMDEDGVYRTAPWFDDLAAIPTSMHEELAAAAREHGTAIEINAGAIFANPIYPIRFKRQYAEYLALMKDLGVRFALASDSHAAGYAADRIGHLQGVVDELGLTPDDLWRPRDAE